MNSTPVIIHFNKVNIFNINIKIKWIKIVNLNLLNQDKNKLQNFFNNKFVTNNNNVKLKIWMIKIKGMINKRVL
jgi:hypothetical protein